MNVEIYIPTLNRASKARQVTLNEFLTKSNYKPWLVAPMEEYKIHRKYYENVLVCREQGIGKVRQWILENSEADVVIMADDDMKFQNRVNGSVKLEQSTDLNPMIQLCLDQIEQGIIHGGVSARQGNNHEPLSVRECTRCCNFHYLNRKKVLATKGRFDQLPVMEDFHFILTLLTSGFPNRVIFDYCWNQIPGSVGGCNTYRTLELQAKAANMLHVAFPEFVTVVKKMAKTDWSIAKGERSDVRVQWLKAYQSSQRGK